MPDTPDQPPIGDSPESPPEPTIEEERLRAMDQALHFLGYRARSVEEVRARLRRHGHESDIIESVVLRLLELGYLDDEAFALILARDFLGAQRPKGERVVMLSLREKGIDEAVARSALERALEEADETPRERVLRAAERWSRRLRPGEDMDRARRRLWGYLGRRGFDPGLIGEAVERVLPSN